MNKTVKSQRSKAIDTAILKFVKAVENSTTFDEMFKKAKRTRILNTERRLPND